MQVSFLASLKTGNDNSPASRKAVKGEEGTRRRSVLESLEPRVVLAGSPTMYMVSLTGGSSTDGSGNSGTLPYVISQANANTNSAGSEIIFESSVFNTPKTIDLASTLVLSETAGPEVIDATGVSPVAVSGGDSSFGVIEVDTGTTATVTRLTIGGGSAIQGGGINDGGTLTLTDVTLSSNRAADLGGGIAVVDGGSLTIDGSAISDNTADYEDGGAIAVLSGGSLTVQGSTISDNSVSDSDGGGIAVFYGGSAKIQGTTFSDNDALYDGGAVFSSGTLEATGGCDFTGNSAGTGVRRVY